MHCGRSRSPLWAVLDCSDPLTHFCQEDGLNLQFIIAYLCLLHDPLLGKFMENELTSTNFPRSSLGFHIFSISSILQPSKESMQLSDPGTDDCFRVTVAVLRDQSVAKIPKHFQPQQCQGRNHWGRFGIPRIDVETPGSLHRLQEYFCLETCHP